METRDDVLVYSTGPLKEGIEVSGPIDVDALRFKRRQRHRLHREADRCLPDGTAYNIDENIQRAPLSRGVRQAAGLDGERQGLQGRLPAHADQQLLRRRPQFRIEISSSNFPRFDRNLNTGGNNVRRDQGRGGPQRRSTTRRSTLRASR